MSAITLDGSVEQDWATSDRIDTKTPVPGYSVYGKFDSSTSTYFLALKSDDTPGSLSIGSKTTMWLNTDMNAGTGYQVFGWSVGAEYKVEFGGDSIPNLYKVDAQTGAETLISSGVQSAFSQNGKTIELAIPQTSLSQNSSSFTPGTVPGLGLAIDVNDQAFLPANYGQPYNVRIPATHIDDGQLKVGIVYSETSAAKYFSETAYSDLFMSAQNQATMAGIPYDVLSESDLKDTGKLAQYDTLIFPSFGNVKQADLSIIQNALTDAVYKYGVSLVAAGNFMTNDENGAPLTDTPYARMNLLLGVQPVGFDSVSSNTVTASGNSAAVIGYTAAEEIHTYLETPTSKVGTAYFSGVDASAQVVATQTATGGTAPGTPNAAVLATHTGGNNVFFATEGMLADSNMLGHALDYTIQSQKGQGPELSLQMSRFSSLVATRVDMDQANNLEHVQGGILNKFLSVIEGWKDQYDFAGSYYIDTGNGANGTGTDWSLSGPIYKQLIALEGEIGSHSVTHPEDTNILSDSALRDELKISKEAIEAGLGIAVEGFAVPGAPETLATDHRMYEAEPSYTYLTGRYSGVGAGYPGAFGYLTTLPTDKQDIFLAPNMKSDFSLVEAAPEFGGGKSPQQAADEWKAEFDALSSHSDLPVALWTWHDYGPTMWSVNGPGSPSSYTTAMYTDFISYAHQKGGEFITLADLADRIVASETAKFDYSYDSGSETMLARVSGNNLGNFALDLGTGQHIASVSTGGVKWYAYDDDSVFLPGSLSEASYSIQLGTSATRETHITSLPMRADLVSVSGNGRDLEFQATGDGHVTLELADLKGQEVKVTGAEVFSQTETQLVLNLVGSGNHDVSVKLAPVQGGEPQPQNAHYFGMVSYDVNSPAGEVYALYDAVFDRATDVSGQQHWTGALTTGMSLHDLAQILLQSPEGQAHLGISDNTAFVEALYQSALHRSSDPGGLQGWTSLLDQGASKADVALGFAFSPENIASIQPALDAGIFTADSHATDVARLYYGLLDRAPDAAGLEGWTVLSKAGAPLQSIAQGFLGSNEYTTHSNALSDAAYVQELYENALGRPAEAGGLEGWTGLLSSGGSRADVAVGIADSPEANQHLLSNIEAGWHLSA